MTILEHRLKGRPLTLAIGLASVLWLLVIAALAIACNSVTGTGDDSTDASADGDADTIHDARDTLYAAGVVSLVEGAGGEERAGLAPGEPVQEPGAQDLLLANPAIGVDTHGITAIAVEPAGSGGSNGAWVGTRGGLLYLANGQVERHLTRLDGLKEHHVSALHFEGGVLQVAFAGAGCQQLVNNAAGVAEPMGTTSTEPELVDCPAHLQEERIVDFGSIDGRLKALTWRGDIVDFQSGEREDTGVGRADRLVSCGSLSAVTSRGMGTAIRRRIQHSGLVGWEPIREPRIVNDVLCSTERRGQRLLLASPAGLTVVEMDQLEIETRTLESSVAPAKATDGHVGQRRHITALARDGGSVVAALADGQVVRGTEPQLFQGGAAHVAELDHRATALSSAGDTVLIGTEAGLYTVSSEGVEVHGTGPGDTDVAALSVNEGGLMAVAMFRNGVAVLEPLPIDPDVGSVTAPQPGVARTGHYWRRWTEAEGMPTNEVNALAWHGHTLWTGTTRGLVKIDTVSGALELAHGVDCQHVNALHVRNGMLLVGTSCGLYRLDAATGHVLDHWTTAEGLPHRIVYTVTVHKGLIAVGTNDGLAFRPVFEPLGPGLHTAESRRSNWTVVRARPGSLEDNWITALGTDADGQLLVGTYSGGLYRSPDLVSYQRIEGPKYVNLNAITTIGEVSYVGGLSEGLWRVVAGQAQSVPASELPGNDVTSVARSGSRIWIASRSGVFGVGLGVGL